MDKICKYNNSKDCKYIGNLLEQGKQIILSKYLQNPIMYLLIIQLEQEDKEVMIKIGYTEDILERISTLSNEYECGYYLVKLKIVNGKKDEYNFHKKMISAYKKMYLHDKCNGVDIHGLYKMDRNIINEFYNYVPIKD